MSVRPYLILFTEIICFLFILLFSYAALSKLWDFNLFKIQLGQSPLLTAFAGWVAWGIPIIELLTALLLAIPKYRLVALYAALGLMSLFTLYIIAILKFSDFVPCSCGGIFERMGWQEHLIFNVVFVILAILGILMMPVTSNSS